MSMDEQPDEIPEYDFTGGVRGKYAERLGGADASWIQEMAKRDAQQWAAEGLQRFQNLEAYLVAYFALLHGRNVQDASVAAWEALENPRSTSYLTLLKDLETYPDSPPDLTVYLTSLFSERNWLVHRSFHSNKDPAEVAGRLSHAAEAARGIDTAFYKFLLHQCRASGITIDDAKRQTDQVIREWAAA